MSRCIGVRQSYQYAYAAPVTDLRQRLIMVPADRYGDQRLLTHRLDITGAEGVATRWETDRFGNRVCRVTAARVPGTVDFAVEFEVERGASPLPIAFPSGAALYLAPTALTAPDDRLRGIARAFQHTPDVACQVGEWAAGAIRYELGVTGVQTPAAMALALGRGVCQDYAHLAIAVLRLAGVPARYVSGHLLGEGAPHAWFEALLPDDSVVSYDPTHRRAPDLNYITVAVGRDYADVAPTSGSFTGHAAGRFTAHKDAWVAA
jgi:transglutaminase-like putative cysteine protease